MNREFSSLVEQFQRDGFVHVPALVAAEEIRALGVAVAEGVALRKRNDTRAPGDKSPYEQSFIQCQYLWEDNSAIRPLTFHAAIVGFAAKLIGAERVRLWQDQALFKEAGGRQTDAHQDHAYWPIAEPDTVTAWIPLVEVNDATGCMGYVPGSHKGECQFFDIFNASADSELDQRYADRAVFVPCVPGDVIFHHGRTIHMAKPNRSDRMRQAYTVIYFRDGCTRGNERPHPSVDRDGIQVGQPINGGATPIAWPLPQGSYPQPAPWPAPSKDAERRKQRVDIGVLPQSAR